jgi:tetratricopeptide (TPR) repeat protein
MAIEAAKKTAEKVPVGEMKTLHFLQNFAATPLLAYTRFGKWNDILTNPKPNDDIKHLKLIWHYSRGIAFIKKNNLKEAEEELGFIKDLTSDPDLETNLATGFDPSTTIAKLAFEIVSGELASAKGDLDLAVKHLKKAVEIEDGLTYNEPSAWHIPPRQNLGAVLMEAKKYNAAETIYKEDLEILRQNGWSLMGLYNCLKAQNKMDEAAKIKQEFDKAWKDADIKINTSVL